MENNSIDAYSLGYSFASSVQSSPKGLGIDFTGTFISKNNASPLDVEEGRLESEFYSNLQYWNNAARFMSTNNYDNANFRAIVDMGEAAVPFIIKELEKGPSSLVQALECIYPGRIRFKGFVSLKRACDVWLKVLHN